MAGLHYSVSEARFEDPWPGRMGFLYTWRFPVPIHNLPLLPSCPWYRSDSALN